MQVNLSGSDQTSLAFVEEAKKIVESAEKRGIILRIMGAVAVRIHCEDFFSSNRKLDRTLTDIDLIGYGRQRDKILHFFSDLGFKYDRRITQSLVPSMHFVFESPRARVDVFFDKLQMCHTIDFGKELELDRPTISPANLLLEKTQIVQLNEKDAKDLIALLASHDFAVKGDAINAEYVARLLSKEWGFYYTVTTNLKRIRDEFLQLYPLSSIDNQQVQQRVDMLLTRIEQEPKSIKWKMRSSVGTKQKWYQDVEEILVGE